MEAVFPRDRLQTPLKAEGQGLERYIRQSGVVSLIKIKHLQNRLEFPAIKNFALFKWSPEEIQVLQV